MFRPALLLLTPLVCFGASNLPPDTDQRLAHDIYKEIIEIKSGFTTGATTPVVDAIAKRLRRRGRLQANMRQERRQHQQTDGAAQPDGSMR